jgi:hypothetical protein
MPRSKIAKTGTLARREAVAAYWSIVAMRWS